jgi:hypothetical protein
MKLWDRFIPLVFPGSVAEFRDARRIHYSEIRMYRWRPQYIAGVCCFLLPLIYLFVIYGDWLTRGLLVLLVIGEICIRDTISEHYCLALHRMGVRRASTPNKALQPTAAAVFGLPGPPVS